MTAAARQALRRSREARGLAVYGVEVDVKVLNALEVAGLLKERDIIDQRFAERVNCAVLKDCTRPALRLIGQ